MKLIEFRIYLIVLMVSLVALSFYAWNIPFPLNLGICAVFGLMILYLVYILFLSKKAIHMDRKTLDDLLNMTQSGDSWKMFQALNELKKRGQDIEPYRTKVLEMLGDKSPQKRSIAEIIVNRHYPENKIHIKNLQTERFYN